MLRPKIFPTLWKTWVAYGLPHGFVRHDKILPIQPRNLKKTLFQQNRFFSRCQLCHVFLPARSHSQPLAATRVAASGCKWPLHVSGRKWPQVAAPSEWPQVVASGRKWPPQTVPSKWPQVAAPSEWPQVAASGHFLWFQFPPSKQPPCYITFISHTHTLTHMYIYICIYTYVYIYIYIYIYIWCYYVA